MLYYFKFIVVIIYVKKKLKNKHCITENNSDFTFYRIKSQLSKSAETLNIIKQNMMIIFNLHTYILYACTGFRKSENFIAIKT